MGTGGSATQQFRRGRRWGRDRFASLSNSAASPGLTENSARRVPGLGSPGSIPQRPFFKVNSKNGGITATSVSVLYVSTHLDAIYSSVDVRGHLGKFFGPREFRCTKLKTRCGGYSSLHVAAVDGDIEALLDPNTWPEVCVFREFQGRLTASRVYDEGERID